MKNVLVTGSVESTLVSVTVFSMTRRRRPCPAFRPYSALQAASHDRQPIHWFTFIVKPSCDAILHTSSCFSDVDFGIEPAEAASDRTRCHLACILAGSGVTTDNMIGHLASAWGRSWESPVIWKITGRIHGHAPLAIHVGIGSLVSINYQVASEGSRRIRWIADVVIGDIGLTGYLVTEAIGDGDYVVRIFGVTFASISIEP